MKTCSHCSTLNPNAAQYCMQCGRALPVTVEPEPETRAGLGLFGLTLAGSVLLSLVLMFVFNLPIIFLAGFLPLFWWKGRK